MRRVFIMLSILLAITGCSSLNIYKNNENEYGQNDLMRAVYYQDIEMVKEKLKNKTLLYDTDVTGATILHYVARYGTKEIADYILKQENCYPLLKKKDAIEHHTPLQEALLARNKEVAKLFFQSTSTKNIDQVDSNGQSLLHLAVTTYQDGMVSYLLKKGVNPNLQDNKGNTAAHLLLYCLKENICDADYEQVKIFKDLVKYGLNPNLPNNDNQSVQSILGTVNMMRPGSNLDRYGFIFLRTIELEYKRGTIDD